MSELPLEAARESGLMPAGRPVLVLLSGGGDSVCLLHVALRLGARVSALHVNYGLRPGADEDEEFVRALCERLGVPLHAKRLELPEGGNLQERAREARYALAEGLTRGEGSDPLSAADSRGLTPCYAVAHTASDQAETVLYRLAVSPGSRALLGMAPQRGRLVRPLLEVTRAEVRDYLRARRLDWREDPSNADRRFARARVRHDLLEALRTVGPAAERTIAETARQLREEADVLDAAVSDAIDELGGGPAVSLAALREHPPALRRLVLRRLAEQATAPAAPRALSRREADEILTLDDRGTKALDLGSGLRAVAEYGTLRFTRAREEAVPDPAELTVPGRVRFGDWEVEASLGGPGDVTVTGLGPTATVRAWREGDRMRPAGLGGTKTLQDLFTDRKVPRALRHTLPVVEAAGEIVWVAGVAVGERFSPPKGSGGEVALTARSITRRAP
jgi:tRNA(Ile)-lysidine synthase